MSFDFSITGIKEWNRGVTFLFYCKLYSNILALHDLTMTHEFDFINTKTSACENNDLNVYTGDVYKKLSELD